MSLFTNAKRQFNTYVTAGIVLNSEFLQRQETNSHRLLQHFLSHHSEYVQLQLPLSI